MNPIHPGLERPGCSSAADAAVNQDRAKEQGINHGKTNHGGRSRQEPCGSRRWDVYNDQGYTPGFPAGPSRALPAPRSGSIPMFTHFQQFRGLSIETSREKSDTHHAFRQPAQRSDTTDVDKISMRSS